MITEFLVGVLVGGYGFYILVSREFVRLEGGDVVIGRRKRDKRQTTLGLEIYDKK